MGVDEASVGQLSGYEQARREAIMSVDMFAAGARSRHESEGTEYSAGWRDAAETILGILLTFPRSEGK